MCSPPGPPPPPLVPPFFGAIAFNGHTPDWSVWSSVGSPYPGFYTGFKHTIRLGWASSAGSDNWYLYSNVTPSSIPTQSIVDNWFIKPSKGRLDFLFHLWYGDATLPGIDPLDISQTWYSAVVYRAHTTSPHVADVKRAVMLIPEFLAWPGAVGDPTWKYMATWAAYLVGQFADPNYMKDSSGRPVVGVFTNPPINTGAANARWLEFLALLGPVYLMTFGNVVPSVAAALHAQAAASYGVAGAQLVPNGPHPWSDQESRDIQNSGPFAGLDVVRNISFHADQRGIKGAPAETVCGWAWRPSVPDMIADYQSAIAMPAKYIILAEGTGELAEGGGSCLPGVQDDSLRPPGDSVYLDPLAWVRGTTPRPGSYDYWISSRNSSYIVGTATWAVTKALTGAYDSNELTASTIADTLDLTLTAHVIGAAATAIITPMGATGPNRGLVGVYVNGVLQGSAVDMFSVSAVQHTVIKAVTASAGDVVSVRPMAAHGGGSTNLVGCDSFMVTYAP